MSGIEIAGIILAVMPLIVTAVEHYSGCLDEYSHYKSTLNGLQIRLRIDQTLFQGTMERLLLPCISEEERILFFPDIPDRQAFRSLWSSPALEAKFRVRLGARYDTFLEAVQEMRKVLDKLMDKLDIDAKGKPRWIKKTANPLDPSSQNASRIRWEWRKIRRSLGKKERDKLLTKFEDVNALLGKWVENKEILTVNQNSNEKEAQRKSFLDYFELVRNHAGRLHAILRTGWLCSCITPHGANLELDPRHDHQSLAEILPSFRVSFSFFSMPDQTQEIHRQWKETEIKVDDLDQEILARINPSPGTSHLAVPQINFSRPRVRFQTDIAETAGRNPAIQPTAPVPSSSHPPTRTCLCQALRSAQIDSQDICSLPDITSNKIARIKSSSQSSSPENVALPPTTLHLGNLLPSHRSQAPPSAYGHLSRQQRVGLAVSLTSAVLQLYESPWMDESWGKRDIYFTYTGLDEDQHPSISKPHVSRTFQTLQATAPTISNDQGLLPSFLNQSIINKSIINKTLFALGIVLIELCLNKPFEDLRPAASMQMPNHTPNILDDYDIANKAISDVYQEGGDDYGYVVQRCLRCEFQGQDSLKKLDVPRFRSLVYEGVLEPLVNDYKKYSLYQL